MVAIEVGGSSVQSVQVSAQGLEFVDGVPPIGIGNLYGFASPGLVESGYVRGAHHIGWGDVFAPDELGTPPNVAVSLNDAEAQADGEWRLRGLKRGELTYVGVGTGVGAVRIIDGTLLPIGLGHETYYGALVCGGCGQEGCLDANIGAHSLPPAPLDEATMDRVSDSLVRAILRSAPARKSTIVFGGGVIRRNSEVFSKLRNQLDCFRVESSMAPPEAKSAAFVAVLDRLAEQKYVTARRG
jgi:predicted NBD/HSP70 family sugar kinase